LLCGTSARRDPFQGGVAGGVIKRDEKGDKLSSTSDHGAVDFSGCWIGVRVKHVVEVRHSRN